MEKGEKIIKKKTELKKAAESEAKKTVKRANAVNDFFRESGVDTSLAANKIIKQPEASKINLFIRNINWKKIRIILGIIFVVIVIIGGFMYWRYEAKKRGASANVVQTAVEKWYAIKLVNGELFFGLVSNPSADPLVVKNVYYDYDHARQASSTDEAATNSIRLVKRGKESYGPEGTLNIVRSQVLYMEALKESSKVLQAILENEK